MKRGQVVVLALAVAAIAVMAVVAGGGGKDGGGGGGSGQTAATGPAKAPPGSVEVSFPYSPEKDALLKPLIKDFNASGVQVGGKRVVVVGQSVSSGDTQTAIAKGTAKPVAWSPANSLWGQLLNYVADQPLVADRNPSLVRSPVVIAMWQPMARALGWPKKHLGFSDVLELARSKAGWADFGHPEWGKFKLVHTNPDFSTVGLLSVVAEYYSATGKTEGLQTSDIPRARAKVKQIESSIVHYGDTTLFIEQQLQKEGLGYASAAAMEETTLVHFNQHRGTQPKLVAIYPREGTFYDDDPFIVLKGAWVSDAQRRGAAALLTFLRQKLTPQLVARDGFRPGDPNAKAVPPVDAAHGADPAQPTRVLGLPEPRVLDRLKRTWRADRKPANVVLVMDTSGSMTQERRLESAKAGLKTFLRQAAPQDRVGLTTFSDEIHPLVPVAPMRTNRTRLLGVVGNLIADGGTALYDATDAGVAQVAKLADTSRINAVVLLTDGENTQSMHTAEELVQQLAAQGDSSKRVRVFTIAYSAGSAGAVDTLKRIADASGGKAYEGKTSDIEAVYLSISSFF